MSSRHSVINSNFFPKNFEHENPISYQKTFYRKTGKNLDNINEKTKEIFISTFEENFFDILLKSKDSFLKKIINESEKILINLFPKDKQTLNENIQQSKIELEKMYSLHYNFLNSEWKKYQKQPKNYNFLIRFRKHCIYTENIAYHNCKDKKSKLIEIKDNKSNEISHLICTECKKCFLKKEIILFCNKCNLEYYSCYIPKEENINFQLATWEKYHCGRIVNNTMKCIKCQNNFYLSIKDNYLVCLNKKCNFKAKPQSIIWICALCKKEFKSNAKIYNPLEIEIIKKAINKTLLFKNLAYPTELPCCNYNVKELNFFHKEDCNGQLYKGKLSEKDIIVCNKCHAMNFYDKFVWICPKCNKKFRNYKSVWGNFFKKKEYLIPELNSSNRFDDDDNNNNILYNSVNLNDAINKKLFKNIGFDNSIKTNLSFYDLQKSNDKDNIRPKKSFNSLIGDENNIKFIAESYLFNRNKKKPIFLMDILQTRNKLNEQINKSQTNLERNKLLMLSPQITHKKNPSQNDIIVIKEIPHEQENNNYLTTNDNSYETSNQQTKKINKIKLNLNETFEKSKGISNEEEDSFSNNNNENNEKTIKTFNSKKTNNEDIEEIEKEERDVIKDLEDEDNYLNLGFKRQISNNFKYQKKNSTDKNDINNLSFKERKESLSSNGDLSITSETSNLNFNILTNPEKLNFISKEGLIPEFDTEDFEYLDPIGDGSFGKIYLVKNKYDNSKYALKKIICHDLKEVKNFQRELELVYSKTHDNIMKIISIQYKCLDITTYSIYILMEVALSDWNNEIKRRNKIKNYYKENEIIIILNQLNNALLYLETEGIAHRDIKPQNILIFENNIFKVTDFGEAKTISDTSQEATLRGSELYMSPILYNGLKYNQRNVKHNPYKSDVFSLGFCLLYALTLNLKVLNDLREIISMKVVYNMVSRALKKNYSSKMIRLICKMIELDERERFSFGDIEKYIKENY